MFYSFIHSAKICVPTIGQTFETCWWMSLAEHCLLFHLPLILHGSKMKACFLGNQEASESYTTWDLITSWCNTSRFGTFIDNNHTLIWAIHSGGFQSQPETPHTWLLLFPTVTETWLLGGMPLGLCAHSGFVHNILGKVVRGGGCCLV